MRLKFLGLGIVLIFIGLLFISISQIPVTTTEKNTERVAVGEQNSTEINATLNTGDEFSMSYSGGSRYVSQEDVDVNVTVYYDSRNESKIVPYITAKTGIVANHTGLYKMQLLGLPIDPSYPLILTVMKIHQKIETLYPNSYMLPIGLSTIVGGLGVSVWGTTSSKRKVKRNRKHRK